MSMVHDILCKHTIGDGEKIVIDPVKSNGVYLVDLIDGKKYLDCSSQYASMALGWNNPTLKKYLEENKESLNFCNLHKIANCDFYTTVYAEFVSKFSEITSDFKHLFFVEGGTLGVENAIKAAFDWKAKKLGLTHKASNSIVNKFDVIHLQQAFHGRSGYCLSITNTIANKVSLFPKFNWTRIKNPKLEFPIVESKVAIDEELSLLQAENALKSNNVAAIVLETIQGEGGDNHFRTEYFKALRKLADQYEALLILDEVQTGVGLTGKMWAYQHSGIIPDIIAFGKKTQVCGFASTDRIDEVSDNVFRESSRISSTWGGNIIDMYRFTQIIEILQEQRLVDNAKEVGEYFLNKLYEVKNIKNVRGKGLMIAFDLNTTQERNEVLKKLQSDMAILPCGEKSIRLRPHLIFSKDNVDEAIYYINKSVS
jgi:L-lysine 6-transaminase